jgi:hypothetical protein
MLTNIEEWYSELKTFVGISEAITTNSKVDTQI